MFSLWCIDWVGSLYANRILCISVLRVASGPRVKLASCKSALNSRWFTLLTVLRRGPGVSLTFCCFVVYSTRRFALCLNLVLLFLCFSVLLALRLPRLGKRELILVLFIRLFDLCLFGFIGFFFLLVSRKGCGLWLWHSLDFSLTCFFGVQENQQEVTKVVFLEGKVNRVPLSLACWVNILADNILKYLSFFFFSKN